MYQSADFLSQYAQTHRFSIGRPRNFTIDDKNNAVYFLQAAKGMPHNFLSLSGVSHMTQGATTVENLLKLEVDFFVQHLKS